MSLMTLTDPTQVPVVEGMLQAGPAGDPTGDGEAWAQRLLGSARTLPNERRDLRAAAAARVSVTAGVEEVTQRWAALVGWLADPTTPSPTISDAIVALAEVGAPMHALQGLARLGRRARAQDQRALGEILQLTSLAVCDAFAQAPPLDLAHEQSGRDRHAALAAPALTALGHGASGLADYLETVAGELAGDDNKLAHPAIRAAVVTLRAPQAHGSDLQWVQGTAARGLAFALPAAAEARFAAYRDYLLLRGLHPAWVAVFVERWVHVLMQQGRLREASGLLDEAESQLPDEQGSTFARITLLRAWARVSRHAGDLPRALSYSDRAVKAMQHAEGQLSGSSRAAIWLNRSAILLKLNDRDNALTCARRAAPLYQLDGFSPVGETEALEVEIAADPDRQRAARLAADMVARDRRSPLPEPIRASALWRCGEALTITDRPLALATLTTAATLADSNRSHVSVEAPLVAARALLNDDPTGALTWAERAVRAAAAQHNLLLRARAGLLLARAQHATGDDSAAVQTAGHTAGKTAGGALQDLTNSLIGLTAEGETSVLTGVGNDLRAIFDLAVAVDDPRLALNVAELGRAIRLAAVMRLDPNQLPPAVRAALSEATAATKVADGDGFGGEAPTSSSRAVAVQTALQAADALASAAGEIFRTVTVAPMMDIPQIRSTFPFAHLLTLSEHQGTLRWGWWAPGAHTEPTAGNQAISKKLSTLLTGYADGNADALPGDVAGPLVELLPPGLLHTLRHTTSPVPLMISPMGRLWHVPYPAIPLEQLDPTSLTRGPGPGPKLLMHAATLTLTPSLRLAHDLAARDRQRPASAGKVAGYCNPTLPGAQMEQQTLTNAWGPDYTDLGGVHTFGSSPHLAIEVMATHATNAPGLAQAVTDHTGHALTAGQCITRQFSRIVILGTCHGYGTAGAETEPIGLLTVISARGATWVAGGHQRLHDATTGWVLSHAHQQLRAGATLPAAIRNAQIAYLHALEQEPSLIETELRRIVDEAGGPYAARQPWCWALTVTGPASP